MGSEAKIPPANRKLQMQSGIVPGDCLEVLRFLDAESVDLTVFSPPYDNIRDYREEWAVDFSALGESLFRVVKDGGVCAVVIGDGTKNFAKSMTTFKLAVDWLKHPATYPDKLAEDLILCFSEPGDMVLDPMCGSGTTCVMAAKNHREYFGIEISREYCEIAERRMRVELKQRNFSLMESSVGYSGKQR